MTGVPASVSSPLRVRARKGRLWAEDSAGEVVVDGKTRDEWPQRYVAQTQTGTHRVAARVESGDQRYLPVLDGVGDEVARIETPKRGRWVLVPRAGGSAEVTKHRGILFATAPRCEVGTLCSATAPRLAPQRYYALALDDSLLALPDRDALVVALVWICESTIADLIRNESLLS